MKYRFILFLMVLLLASGCSTSAGEAAPNATHAATLAASVTSLPSATVSPTPILHRSTETPPTTGTATPALTGMPTSTTTFTPFPNVSPTALPLPTRVEPAAPTTPPGGPPAATPQPGKTLLDQYLPKRVKVAETAHFIFYAQGGYFPVDQAWWTAQAEQAYSYVSQRLDNRQVKHKIELGFQPPDKQSCPIRGLTSESGAPMIIIFASQDSSPAYLLGVLSHEVGHAISNEGFPEGLPGNIALAEGVASWGSGKYWATWKNVASIDDLVRGYLKDGSYEPIHENTDLNNVYPWQKNTGTSQDCLARRDKLYTEWASFVGYLIDTYGWPKAHQLFRSPTPQRQPGQTIFFPPDYQGIYGKALNQMEWEWLKEIGTQ